MRASACSGLSCLPILRLETGANRRGSYTCGMIKVGCAGFPIPLSRYFQAFGAVEIVDTELGIPVAGTMRRWKREAPRGFVFTLVAPASLTEQGFARKKEHQELLEELGRFANQLGAQAVVFKGPPSFEPGRTTEKSLYSFLGSLPDDFPSPDHRLAFLDRQANRGGYQAPRNRRTRSPARRSAGTC